MPPQFNQPAIGATVTHYRIVCKLGEGGMGVVYEAEDLTLARRVALKFCASGRDDAKLRANLLKEARAASSLSHPNIAHIYEFVENPGGDPFISMELVSGANLRSTLNERRLSVEETLKVATAVASALAEAHRHGVIHRDIKPGNIQITSAGEVKVLDFGIARTPVPHAAGETESATQTLEGFSGTPLYMSPEQASGELLDARSDLFSLGAVLYECLAGKSPFAADTLTSVMARLLTSEPPPPSRLNPQSPANLDRIVLKLLSKDRRQRYASADELLADLRAPGRHPSRRRAVAAIAAGLVCAGGAAALWLRIAHRHREPAAAAIPWYRDGIAALHTGSYHRASKALARAVEIDPSYAMAHAYLAEAWYELDYLERAKDELLKTMSARSSLPEVEGLHLDAIRQTVTGEFRAAAETFRKMSATGCAGRARRSAARPGPRAGTQPGYEEGHGDIFRSDSPGCAQNAAAWLRLGALEARTGAREDSGRSLDRAESLFQAASNVEGVTECLYVRARYARTPAEARELIGKALSAARVTDNDQQQIKLLLLSSNAHIEAGQTAEALDDANRAIAIARASGIENLVSRGLIDLGNALFVKGRIAEALRTIAGSARHRAAEPREAVGSARAGEPGQHPHPDRGHGAGLAGRTGRAGVLQAGRLPHRGRASPHPAGPRRAQQGRLRRGAPRVRGDPGHPEAGRSVAAAGACAGGAGRARICSRTAGRRRCACSTRRGARSKAIGNSSGAATNELNVALMHAMLGHKDGAAPSQQAADASPLTALQIVLMQERFGEARAKAEALLQSADASDLETRRGASLVLGLALARSGAGARGLEACRRRSNWRMRPATPRRKGTRCWARGKRR